MPKTEKEKRDDATIKSLYALAYYEDDEPHKVRMMRAVELLKAQRDELVKLRAELEEFNAREDARWSGK